MGVRCDRMTLRNLMIIMSSNVGWWTWKLTTAGRTFQTPQTLILGQPRFKRLWPVLGETRIRVSLALGRRQTAARGVRRPPNNPMRRHPSLVRCTAAL